MINQKKLFLLSIVAYLLFSLSCLLTIKLIPSTSYIIFGAPACLLTAVLFHILGKKGLRNNFYLVSIGLTNLLSGISVGCYLYLEENYLSLSEYLISFAAFLLLCIILLAIHKKIGSRRKAIFLSYGILIFTFIPFIYLWITKGIYLYAFLCFSLIMNLFYNLSYLLHKKNSTLLRDFSFGSFGAFFIVTYLVLVLITEGDALDLLDSLEVPANRKNKNTISM